MKAGGGTPDNLCGFITKAGVEQNETRPHTFILSGTFFVRLNDLSVISHSPHNLPLSVELHGMCVILILQVLEYDGPLVTIERVIGLVFPVPTSRYTVK